MPLVVIGTVGLLWSLPVPDRFYAISPLVNWGSLFLMAATVYYFIISVPLAIGMAASIRVGFNVGSNNITAARRSAWVAIGVALMFALVAAILVFFGRELIAGLYTTEVPVLMLAVQLLLFVVLYQFFDDVQVVAIGALRGFKDTRTPMWVAIVSYWAVGLPVGPAH